MGCEAASGARGSHHKGYLRPLNTVCATPRERTWPVEDAAAFATSRQRSSLATTSSPPRDACAPGASDAAAVEAAPLTKLRSPMRRSPLEEPHARELTSVCVLWLVGMLLLRVVVTARSSIESGVWEATRSGGVGMHAPFYIRWCENW